MVVVVVVVVVMITVMSAIMVIAMLIMLVTRRVLAIVPIVTDKEHGTPAGIVFAAVPCPMSFISRRNMQIDRPTVEGGVAMNDHGSRVDNAGRLWSLAKIDLPEESGLPDIDGNANVRCHYLSGDEQQPAQQNAFHIIALSDCYKLCAH